MVVAPSSISEDSPTEPRAAYATSKLAAERAILAMADDCFAPMAFRKGTVFGFSPRMRYDVVVNSFVKDALSRAKLFLHYGGGGGGRTGRPRGGGGGRGAR